MKVTLKLGAVVASADTLRVVAATKMPVKTSYRLNKMLRLVSKEVKIYEEEKGKVFEELGESAGEGLLQIKEENKEEAKKALDELLDQDVELDIPDVTIDDLGNLQVSPLELQALEPLLNLREDVPPELDTP